MHLFFITRGINSQVETLKSILQGQFFPWKRKNLATGKEEIYKVQGALRPIQLWEYVFPEDHLDEVINSMRLCDLKGKTTHGDFEAKKGVKALLPAFRKILGAKKLPKKVKFMPDTPTSRIMCIDGVAVSPIGYKKDRTQDWEEIGYNQEML